MKKIFSKKRFFSLGFFVLGIGILAVWFFMSIPFYEAAELPIFTKSADKVSVRRGETITYTLSFQNLTGSTIYNFILTDSIPSGTTFLPGSYFGNPTLIDNVLTWPSVNVSNGITLTTSYKVSVDGSSSLCLLVMLRRLSMLQLKRILAIQFH